MRLRCAWMLCLAGCLDPAPKTESGTTAQPAAPGRATTDRDAPKRGAGSASPQLLIQRVCKALHTLPRERRAACCDRPSAFSLAQECSRRLTAAVDAGAVELSAAAVTRCEAAVARAFAGCDWVGPHWLPAPHACLGLLQGRLREGAACRTHLACPAGTYCAGLTTDGAGTCSKPSPVGQPCELGPDALATVLQQDDVEQRHSPCDGGYCRLGTCVAFAPEGQPCGAKQGCGPQARCTAGLCTKGALAGKGEACSIATCKDGLRCVQGKCRAPLPPGAACDADLACYGRCQAGRCARDCTEHPRFRRLSRP